MTESGPIPAAVDPIRVTVIGGYLGAGKTTMVNHVLRHAREPLAVLVNDFGSIDIDESLIESRSDDVMSLANGCICCTLTDGFIGALDRIRALDPRPSRLVIETSGVGDLGEVANYARLPGLALDATVCVVDAEMVREKITARYVGELVEAQIAAAELLVLNKVDLVDADRLDDSRKLLGTHAPGTPVIEVERGAVPLAVLFDDQRDVRRSDEDEHRHLHGAEGFVGWMWTAEGLIDRTELEASLDALPDGVVRAKGLVRTTDAPDRTLVVQVVGRRRELSDGGPWKGGLSRVQLIGLAAVVGSPLPGSFASARRSDPEEQEGSR